MELFVHIEHRKSLQNFTLINNFLFENEEFESENMCSKANILISHLWCIWMASHFIEISCFWSFTHSDDSFSSVCFAKAATNRMFFGAHSQATATMANINFHLILDFQLKFITSDKFAEEFYVLLRSEALLYRPKRESSLEFQISGAKTEMLFFWLVFIYWAENSTFARDVTIGFIASSSTEGGRFIAIITAMNFKLLKNFNFYTLKSFRAINSADVITAFIKITDEDHS